MEPAIHIFAKGDKNPLEYYRQVPNVKRLVVHFGEIPGQAVEQSWMDHVLALLNEAGLGLAVAESFVISNAIKLELAERDAHIEAFCQTLSNFSAAMRNRGFTPPYRVCYDFMGPDNWWRNLLSVRDEQERICIGYDPRQPEPGLERLGDGPRLGYPESYTPKQHARLLSLYREPGGIGRRVGFFGNLSRGRKRRGAASRVAEASSRKGLYCAVPRRSCAGHVWARFEFWVWFSGASPGA